jgi:pantothenate kinase-related protein Tda10
MGDTRSTRFKAKLVADFIKEQADRKKGGSPLLVSLQGPQGSGRPSHWCVLYPKMTAGKSTLAVELVKILEKEPYHLTCRVASLDGTSRRHSIYP